MRNTIFVRTRDELKAAVGIERAQIVITDSALASKIRLVAKAPKTALAAALVAAGASVGMAWNPLGWGMAAVSTAVAGPLVAAVAFFLVSLGVGHLYSIRKNYKITNKTTVTMPDGTVLENATVMEPTR